MVNIDFNVKIRYSEVFCNDFSKMDNSVKTKIKKQIKKIVLNPKVGKPMRNIRKGTREVRIKPFRLSYSFDEENNIITFLRIYHKDKQ